MTRKVSKYKRCKDCGELVLDPVNCANCAAQNPLSLSKRSVVGLGKRRQVTLDTQEGNSEEAYGGQLFKVKAFRK